MAGSPGNDATKRRWMRRDERLTVRRNDSCGSTTVLASGGFIRGAESEAGSSRLRPLSSPNVSAELAGGTAAVDIAATIGETGGTGRVVVTTASSTNSGGPRPGGAMGAGSRGAIKGRLARTLRTSARK
jgi:hypothetical protein